MIVDENAFGALLSYFGVEEEEYGLERPEFVERFLAFRDAVRRSIAQYPFGVEARAVDLGHAVYLEVADGDQHESPLAWVKRARGLLGESRFESVAIVTYGGRWIDEGESFVSTEPLGETGLVTLSNPSEPLRRALYADAASRHDDEREGWGPGVYLDTEAVEPLGIRPKNSPTVLRTAGATFYRVGN